MQDLIALFLILHFLIKEPEKAQKVFNQNKKLNQGRRSGIQEVEDPT